MQQRITPAASLSGSLVLPGDKSISHRYALLSAIAEGVSTLHHYSGGADCQSTLGAVAALGIPVTRENGSTRIEGRGLNGLRAPAETIDAGNSGSTIRMLSGILAAQPFVSRIAGDESLSRRPMDRIMNPLRLMGARVSARDNRFPPLQIEGGPLRAIEYEPAVASAQVKSCVLLAGLFADGETVVREPLRTRDHTEVALREFGADVAVTGKQIRLQPRPALRGGEFTVPGDLSSAAFFLVAATIVPGSALTLRGVGLNPSRSALLDFLVGGGADIKVLDLKQQHGEMAGDLLVRHAAFRGGLIEGALSAAVIDELPVLAILGAVSDNGLEVRNASELRVKETDRIATLAENFQRAGVDIEAAPDGFRVPGRQKFRAATFDSFGDHRIGMAFSVAALIADGESVIEDSGAVGVSFPQFFDYLQQVRG